MENPSSIHAPANLFRGTKRRKGGANEGVASQKNRLYEYLSRRKRHATEQVGTSLKSQ
jgi:hypothetical protein